GEVPRGPHRRGDEQSPEPRRDAARRLRPGRGRDQPSLLLKTQWGGLRQAHAARTFLLSARWARRATTFAFPAAGPWPFAPLSAQGPTGPCCWDGNPSASEEKLRT